VPLVVEEEVVHHATKTSAARDGFPRGISASALPGDG
jgi:hypothetical protein